MVIRRFVIEIETELLPTNDDCSSFLHNCLSDWPKRFNDGVSPCIGITDLDSDKLDSHGPDRVVNSMPDSVGHPISSDSTGFGVDSPGAVAVGESEKRCADSGIDLDALATREYFPPMVDAPIHGIHELSDCD